MRSRAELVVGTAVVLALSIAAGLLGLQQARITDADPRRSSYLGGPSGSRGLAEALERLGVAVERHRRPIATLDTAAAPGALLMFLGPARPLTAREGAALAGSRGDLLLAGPAAGAAIRCVGWDVQRLRDSLRVIVPPGVDARLPPVLAVLAARRSRTAVDTAEGDDGAPVACTAPAARTVDTLLRTVAGRPVALRLGLDDGRRVLLVADDRLFANRALRATGAGTFVLGMLVPAYRRVVIDEYHHGFDASTTLVGATGAWILRSPWGWALLQLAVVATLALLAAGVRFGPVLPGRERRRRSPLEHVRALATALAAAQGHDVAVRLLVQGLRRRLSRAGHVTRGDAAAWLGGLAPAVRTTRGAEALAALTTITRRPASAADVLHAAHAVETLWEELTPT